MPSALTAKQASELEAAVLAVLYERTVPEGSPVPTWVSDELNRVVFGRLEEFRELHIPWLKAHLDLRGARILEIGAGTGSSTVAMVEQGAIVEGIDIDGKSLDVARMRCSMHGFDHVNFSVMNATEIDKCGKPFDLIIYFATLEHMTHSERMSSLHKAWALLNTGGILAVIECPNRLWYFDPHTTLTNFYNWLPDELAIDYRKCISREGFASSFDPLDQTQRLIKLARLGRGASYHEFEILFGPISVLDVKQGLMDYRRMLDSDLDAWWDHSKEGQWRNLLRSFAPTVPSAFFYPWMDVLVEKH